MKRKKPRTISAVDDRLCRIALHYAINERDSFADGYHHVKGRNGIPGRAAARLANQFRRLLKRRYGQITFEDRLKITAIETVNILDVKPNRTFRPGSIRKKAVNSKSRQ